MDPFLSGISAKHTALSQCEAAEHCIKHH